MKKVSEKYLTQLENATLILGIPKGEEKENGAETLFKEIIAEDVTNLGKELEIHVTEANR